MSSHDPMHRHQQEARRAMRRAASLAGRSVCRHHVDYRPFKANRLKRKPGLVIPDGPNEYGMRLVRLDGAALHETAVS